MGYGLGRENATHKAASRTVMLTSGDAQFRARLRQQLTAMRWQVREAAGGAEAMEQLEVQGAEAMVLTDIIAAHLPEIEIFSIDTGRLPEQTHDLLGRLEERYGPRIRLVYPDAQQLQSLTGAQGVNGFQKSLTARLSCCEVRKVEPFKRAIAGYKAWVTGVRREHSATHAQGTAEEWDAKYGLFKLSPLLDWTEVDVWRGTRR